MTVYQVKITLKAPIEKERGESMVGKSSIKLTIKEAKENAEFICLYLKCSEGQSPREEIDQWNAWHMPDCHERLTFPLTLTLKLEDKEKPCGELVINSPEEFPEESVPCPCGHPNHWLLKIERE